MLKYQTELDALKQRQTELTTEKENLEKESRDYENKITHLNNTITHLEKTKNDLELKLSDKEREIVNLYFGIDVSHNYTLEEIAYRLDLTRERVRQIKDKALKKLKQHPSRSLLRMYLEQ